MAYYDNDQNGQNVLLTGALPENVEEIEGVGDNLVGLYLDIGIGIALDIGGNHVLRSPGCVTHGLKAGA